MGDKAPSKTVFVGNIPYGLSEQQIEDLFSSAGKVVNFRLVTDQETGRPKGYGFAEFSDADAAASAVRNLNDHQIMGRQLRVDFSHKDNTGGQQQQPRDGFSNMGAPGAGGVAPPINVSAVPPGVPLPPGVSCPDAISQTLATIPPPQLLDILSQFKGVVTASPDQATDLFRQQPQLAYAIFQCLLTMGLVESDVLRQVIEQVQAPPQQPPARVPPLSTATPPVHAPYQPPQQQQQPPVPPALAHLPPDQLAGIKAIVFMAAEQYNSLGPVEKQQVDAIKMQYGPLLG